MADANSNPSTPPSTCTSASPKRDDPHPMASKIAELNVSQSELMNKLQGLKQDLQDWRSKLDTQVKTYKEELTDLKMTLNTDLDQLKSGFQELRIALQQQQEDISDSLRDLGLEDFSSWKPEAEAEHHVSEKVEASARETADESGSPEGVVEDMSPHAVA
ncbi:hypothetical protein KSP39_PZI002714 [Platanthera zijinensis]|uniref:CAP-Gly domain-containing linker protein 1 n=1 Tax=Platanthera zijinensis TaxID=2320716 RepID=A0AAP0C118_9ASPA